MIAFIGIFLPAFITLSTVVVLDKTIKNKLHLALVYLNGLIWINIINLFLLVHIFENGEHYLNIYAFNNDFAFRYLVMSVVIAVLLGIIMVMIKKNVEFKLEENKIVQKEVKRKDEKKKNKI